MREIRGLHSLGEQKNPRRSWYYDGNIMVVMIIHAGCDGNIMVIMIIHAGCDGDNDNTCLLRW